MQRHMVRLNNSSLFADVGVQFINRRERELESVTIVAHAKSFKTLKSDRQVARNEGEY